MNTDALKNFRIRHSLHAADSSMPDDNSSIFHYTNVRGALGILRSGKLWFTERRHLNDPSETYHAVEKAKELLKNVRELGRHFDEYTNDTMGLEFYIASFSTKSDDLSQWRCYADDGRGVVLGFSYQNSLKHFERLSPLLRQKFKIDYKTQELESRINQAVNEAVGLCGHHPQKHVAAALGEIVLFNGIMTKHPAYEHEGEIRLLYWGNSPQQTDIEFQKRLCVRERNRELVRYVEVPIPFWKNSDHEVLTDILVGPAAPVALIDQFRMTLRSLGIPKPKIDQSNIPYRSTCQT